MEGNLCVTSIPLEIFAINNMIKILRQKVRMRVCLAMAGEQITSWKIDDFFSIIKSSYFFHAQVRRFFS